MQTESTIRKYSTGEREQYLRLWRQSKMTQAAFCQQMGLPHEIFVNWIRPAQKGIELLPVIAESKTEITPASASFTIDLLLPSGIRCQITNASTKEIIGLIQEYERCN